ncbi:MAG TPA: cation-transporting P-type ATPase, partial [Steroidobacteraceae bacterium]
MEKQRQPGFISILARLWRRAPATPEGSAASGVSLGEIAGLAPEEALRRLQGSAEGLSPDEAEARLRTMGPN